ncbi:MAG: hypothetical protein LC799_24450 [Actinobacteria bacterium]|nr:hypothetical protein [Actinomycetota bacterium]
MNNAEGSRRREEDQQRDRKSHEESQSHGSFWGKLGGLLAIFGAVFSVTTFVAPVESTMQKLALSVLVVSASSMMYRAVVALLDKKLDWGFAVLVLVTLGLGSWYVVLLVEDRDSTIMELREQIGTAVDVPPTVTTGRPQPSPPWTSPVPQTAAPAESAPPEFDLSDVDSYSNGTVKLALSEYGDGLELDSYSSRPDSYSDIVFGIAGVSGQNGTQFALLSAGSDTSFATCRDQTSWVPVLDWDQVERGSFACVKAPGGRRGILRIDQMPNLDSREPTVQVTGFLWEPVVDR